MFLYILQITFGFWFGLFALSPFVNLCQPLPLFSFRRRGRRLPSTIWWHTTEASPVTGPQWCPAGSRYSGTPPQSCPLLPSAATEPQGQGSVWKQHCLGSAHTTLCSVQGGKSCLVFQVIASRESWTWRLVGRNCWLWVAASVAPSHFWILWLGTSQKHSLIPNTTPGSCVRGSLDRCFAAPLTGL